MGTVERRRSITTTIAASGIGMSLLAGCSGGDGTPAATVASTVATDSSTPPRRNVDGRLRIGVWLPMSGPAATLGTPLMTAVNLAVAEINDAGGVNGQMVELAERDEGSDPATAFQSLRELLDEEQVDVIVGPGLVAGRARRPGDPGRGAGRHLLADLDRPRPGGAARRRLLRAHHRLGGLRGRGADARP